MGKRKGRRLAALSSTGRRMKLDLFAEPSGDLGGSDAHDKVEGDQEDAIELPNSPSSSGQQTQNPLLLLGQYSDDELEEESDGRENEPVIECSSGNDTKVERLADQVCEDVNIKSVEDAVSLAADQPKTDSDSCLPDVKHEQADDCATKTDSISLVEKQKQMHLSMCASVAVTSEVTGDATSGWKTVLHEESNQYYYWNTETGETSWAVPDVLFGTKDVTFQQKDILTGYASSGPVGTYNSSSVTYSEPGSSLAVQYLIAQSIVDGNEIQMVNEGNEAECPKNLHDVDALQGRKGFFGPGSSSNDAPGDSYDKVDIDLPARVMGQSERLLEKLRLLKGSQGSMQDHDWIVKHILEVEVRHSDIKMLISHGLSLGPFWSHSEVQLRRLEDVVNDEIYQLAKFAVIDEVAAIETSSLKEDKPLEDTGNDTEVDESRGKSILSDEDPCSTGGAADTNVESLTGHPGNHVTASEFDVAASDEIDPKPGSPVVLDVDMDVDMEVEDSCTDIAAANVSDFRSFGPAEQASISGFNSYGQEEQATVSGFKSFGGTEHSGLHMETSSVAPSNAPGLPPPPGEEWIPPPPPDNEEVPPPPPDADCEHIPPPPDDYGVPAPPTEDLQQPSYPTPVSYSDPSVPSASQYNLAYPYSNYQYHANIIAAAPDGQFYDHAGRSQVSLLDASLYHGTVPRTCSQSVPLAVTSVDTCYNVEGTVPPLPVFNNLESAQFLTESGYVGYGPIHMGSFDVSAAAYPATKVDVAPGVTENPSSILPSTSGTQVSSTVPAQSSDVVPAAAVTTSKGQSKVVRTKKRTLAVAPTLRSNKKVSSLVDKWKAAKEEMNESEEDETDSAYDFLERKRQKEIKEWHSRQIATGEAKENANFQPLGGDWREKVKRKRAKAAREAVSEAVKEEKQPQQPDLLQISKDLPSGWQAYWDESTKKVYYGNTITSDTSWTRPSK